VRALAEYWESDFDWRRQEAALNELPQFSGSIDGHPDLLPRASLTVAFTMRA